MKARLAFYCVIALVVLLDFGGVARAAATGQVQRGYQAGDDWEPAIAADRLGHVYLLWPHLHGVPSCSACPSPTMLLQTSSDRGQTWSAPRVLTPNSLGSSQIDAQLAVDPIDGRTVYAAWLQNNKSDVVVLKSMDFGRTWTTPVVTDATNSGTDKPILAVRGTDVYVGFNHTQKAYAAVSHDGALTFSSHLVGRNSQLGWSLGGSAAIDTRDNVYLSWDGYTQNGQANGPVNLYITRSSDKGLTWSQVLLDTSAAPPDCSAFNCGWAFLGPAIVMTVDPNDTLYALWNAGATKGGPERIYFAQSGDHGLTWSRRQDVSLAPQGIEHSFPAITSGGAGNVRIGWMDARNGGRWNVTYRTSTDSGATWSAESRLSSFVPGYSYLDAAGFAFPYGDYWQMAVDDRGQTQAVWGEGPNYTGPGNIWYARTAP